MESQKDINIQSEAEALEVVKKYKLILEGFCSKYNLNAEELIKICNNGQLENKEDQKAIIHADFISRDF